MKGCMFPTPLHKYTYIPTCINTHTHTVERNGKKLPMSISSYHTYVHPHIVWYTPGPMCLSHKHTQRHTHTYTHTHILNTVIHDCNPRTEKVEMGVTLRPGGQLA